MAARKTAASPAAKTARGARKRRGDVEATESYVAYNEQLADAICGHIIEGMSIRAICELPGMPSKSGLFAWLGRYEDFRAKYELATKERAQSRFESLDELMDAVRQGRVDPKAARVIADTIKWQCAIERPDRYGQVSRHEHSGKDGGPIQHQVIDMTPEQRREEIQRLLADNPTLITTIGAAAAP